MNLSLIMQHFEQVSPTVAVRLTKDLWVESEKCPVCVCVCLILLGLMDLLLQYDIVPEVSVIAYMRPNTHKELSQLYMSFNDLVKNIK